MLLLFSFSMVNDSVGVILLKRLILRECLCSFLYILLRYHYVMEIS